jgi:MFS family permease
MSWSTGAILAVLFVDTLGYAIVVPLIPFALREQGAPLVAVGAVFAAFSLCQLATAPLLGRLSDRVGRRPVLIGSLAGSIAGFGMLAVSQSFPVVLLSRIVDGCSAGNVAMCYAAIMDSPRQEQRRQGVAALGAASGAGVVGGLILSATFASYGLGAVAGAAMLLSALGLTLTVFAVPETRRGGILNLDIGGALRLTQIRRAGRFVVLCAALQAAFLLTLPVYFAAVLGLDARGAVALIAFLVLAGAAFQLTTLPRLLGRLGAASVARLLLAVGFGAAALVGVSAGSVLVWVASLLLVVATTTLSPVSTLLLAESNPDAPVGLTMGLNASSATAGQILGPIAGYAAFAFGGSAALGFVCIALVAGAAATLGTREWRKTQPAQ